MHGLEPGSRGGRLGWGDDDAVGGFASNGKTSGKCDGRGVCSEGGGGEGGGVEGGVVSGVESSDSGGGV